jgi:hypothetical protein
MDAKQDEDGRYYTDTILRDVFEGLIEDKVNSLEFNVRPVLNLSKEFFSFNTQKPEGLINLLHYIATDIGNGIVMDFFSGSRSNTSCCSEAWNKVGCYRDGAKHFDDFYEDTLSLQEHEEESTEICQNNYVVEEMNIVNNKIEAKVLKVGILGRIKEVLGK